MGAPPSRATGPQGADMTDQIPNRLSRKIGGLGLAIVVALAVLAGFASPAYANFPHFRSASVSLAGSSPAIGLSATSSASASAQLPDLLFTWTEVGLGSPDVTYRVESVVSATFGCVNGGGQLPSASNKTTVTAPLRTFVELAADQNGRITGSVVLDTGSVFPTGFSCPGGQTLAALSVTFTGNAITDTTNAVTAGNAAPRYLPTESRLRPLPRRCVRPLPAFFAMLSSPPHSESGSILRPYAA